MKYVVLGSMGQLGRDLCPRLQGEVIQLSREEIDLANHNTLYRLEDYEPDVVINCAAYNFVDIAEAEPEPAFRVNAWAVGELAKLCQQLDCILVHYSTDYVFGLDRERKTPFTPDDPPGPVSMYGTSKLAGEYLLRSHCTKHYLIRTCGLYGVWGSGGKGGNFVETMLRLAEQGKSLKVVNDQFCTPSYTVDVANATIELIKTGQYGLHHLTNAGVCTWYKLARTIFELQGLEVDLSETTTTEFGARAQRPPYSVLEQTKAVSPLRSWEEAVHAYLEERKNRE